MMIKESVCILIHYFITFHPAHEHKPLFAQRLPCVSCCCVSETSQKFEALLVLNANHTSE